MVSRRAFHSITDGLKLRKQMIKKLCPLTLLMSGPTTGTASCSSLSPFFRTRSLAGRTEKEKQSK